MQYTIRNIPDHVDAALRAAASEQGKSLNDIAVETLARGAGLSHTPQRKRDLSDLASTWHEDPAFDSALAEQDTVDQAMWPPKPGSRQRTRRSRARTKRAA